MTTHPVGREWVQPGAKVAIWQNGGQSGTVTAYDEIDRVLKRDIVLKSGRRFYFPNGPRDADAIERGTTDNWWPTYMLLATDNRVRAALVAARQLRYRNNVHAAYGAWRTKPTPETADTFIRAIENWKDIQ